MIAKSKDGVIYDKRVIFLICFHPVLLGRIGVNLKTINKILKFREKIRSFLN